MKLARPAVFHPRIALAGCWQQGAGDSDDSGLVAVLGRRGLQACWLPWDDPEVGSADLVILRATHDYAERLSEFLAWTNRVANLLNPPAAIAWNVDRRCLGDLADRGVPTVPGDVVAPGDRVRLPHAGQVFVSPALGTGIRRCSDRSTATDYIAELHAAGHSVFVQADHSTAETALIFLGGKPSHAFVTQAGALHQEEPDFELWDAGAAALSAAAVQVGAQAGELLYARAHLIGARLLELQLVAPSLGWRRLDAATRDLAQRKFALCVESALERLGLGPLSHRRP